MEGSVLEVRLPAGIALVIEIRIDVVVDDRVVRISNFPASMPLPVRRGVLSWPADRPWESRAWHKHSFLPKHHTVNNGTWFFFAVTEGNVVTISCTGRSSMVLGTAGAVGGGGGPTPGAAGEGAYSVARGL